MQIKKGEAEDMPSTSPCKFMIVLNTYYPAA